MPNPSSAARPAHSLEGAEAAARLAGIRQALRVADMIAGQARCARSEPVELTEVWPALPASSAPCSAAQSLTTARLAAELRVALPHIEALLARR